MIYNMGDKILEKVLSKQNDSNIRFSDLQTLLKQLGFECRIKGDHYIYYSDSIPDIINIQPDGNKAKAYQVKQVRQIIYKYHLGGSDNA